MIILPDRNVPRARFLMPVRDSEWRQPSQRLYTYGAEHLTLFRISARTHDGVLVWRGIFEDRADCDAFLSSLITGAIRQEPALWDLPRPCWSPDIYDGLIYAADTQIPLTSSPGSSTTWTVVSDWSSVNTIEGIGGGGGGNNGITTSGGISGGGGGGGAYAKITNLTLTPGATAYRQAGGAGSSGAPASAGSDTWFNKTSNSAPGSSSDGIVAKAGGGASGGTAGTAGSSGSCIGATTNSGGAGGAGGGCVGAAGGGGAAGPNAAGGAGGASGASATQGGGGGGGNNGASGNGASGSSGNGGSGGSGASGGANGGAGGNGFPNSATAGTAGSNGTLWTTAGPGGGGGGGGGVNGDARAGGAGGNYGAGGGGGAQYGANLGSGGTGTQGILVITYTPSAGLIQKNLAMMGM